jgi:ferrous iron transport protein A
VPKRAVAVLDVHHIPLTSLRPGQIARVDEVIGQSDLVQRLRELGLRSGARVEMIRAGSPCLLRLDGLKLGIRAEELSGVLVQIERGAVA